MSRVRGAKRRQGADEEDRGRPEDHRQAQQQLEHIAAHPQGHWQVQTEDVPPDVRVHGDESCEHHCDEEAVAHVGDHRLHRVLGRFVVVSVGGGSLMHVFVVMHLGCWRADVVGHRAACAVEAAFPHPVAQLLQSRRGGIEAHRCGLGDRVGRDRQHPGVLAQLLLQHSGLRGEPQPARVEHDGDRPFCVVVGHVTLHPVSSDLGHRTAWMRRAEVGVSAGHLARGADGRSGRTARGTTPPIPRAPPRSATRSPDDRTATASLP